MRRHLNQRGFTLLEILVVVVILGILASLVLPNFLGRTDQARAIAAKHDIQTLVGVLKLYKLDNGFYPSTAQGLQALVKKPETDPVPRNWKQPYIDQLPKDPWDRPYQYLNPGVHGSIDVFTLGADGESGGDESNADIGNWEASAR
jgi:general secretion pathway protein G